MIKKICECGREYYSNSQKCCWCRMIDKGEDLPKILNLAKLLELNNGSKLGK